MDNTPPVDNQPVQANDHAIDGPPIQVQYPENVPVMGTPPPQDQPTPDTTEQEDPLDGDPQGDDLPPEDPSLPHTEDGDFPSDKDQSGSEDSDASFRTVEQSSPPPSPPRPEGHSPDTIPLR